MGLPNHSLLTKHPLDIPLLPNYGGSEKVDQVESTTSIISDSGTSVYQGATDSLRFESARMTGCLVLC